MGVNDCVGFMPISRDCGMITLCLLGKASRRDRYGAKKATAAASVARCVGCEKFPLMTVDEKHQWRNGEKFHAAIGKMKERYDRRERGPVARVARKFHLVIVGEKHKQRHAREKMNYNPLNVIPRLYGCTTGPRPSLMKLVTWYCPNRLTWP